MAFMDSPKLSSNWRELQKKLGTGPGSNPLKRKRTNEASMNHSSKFHSRPRSKSINLGKSVKDFKEVERPSTSLSKHEAEQPVFNEGVSSTALPGKYIALDCEFVGVGPPPYSDDQLARVSLVNWHGEQVYDSFVSPTLPVMDYRTHVSGIREEDLKQGRPFVDVRADVATFLRNRILVGHWLKSDLKCLQLHHPRSDIRDTALLPRFKSMLGTHHVKLRDISKRVLGVVIQTGEHDSIEDARTTMMLFKATRDDFEKRPTIPKQMTIKNYEAVSQQPNEKKNHIPKSRRRR
jgi:RNA exonuclease 4